MTATVDERAFAREYEQVADEARTWAPRWLLDLKAAAMAEFRERGFPSSRDEDWRFTPIAPIVETVFESAGRPDCPVEKPDWPEHGVLVVNGRWVSSNVGGLPSGVRVVSLSQFAAENPERLAELLGHAAAIDRHPFAALNTGMLRDGAVIHVPDGVAVEAPIGVAHLTIAGGGDFPAAVHPRTLLVFGRNSRATVVESYAGGTGAAWLTNAVTEVFVGANASVRHYRVQDEGTSTYHVGLQATRLARDARYVSLSVSLGGAISRTDIQAIIDDEGVECTLDGLYLADGTRLVDNHTFIDHAKPNCASHEMFKGVLTGRGRGVFNGKILVRQDAQKTDAKQTNQALLLSDEAQVNTKPQLEIFADDVRCTHGATIGQIDENALFYLRSRGIAAAEARRILVHAFAADVLDRISLEPLREQLEETLRERGV